jgi:6-phosphogluconolactonase/glucosamine-6-phosphate isomerase/deaminase
VFNSTANFSHDVFKTVPSTSAQRTTALQVLTGGGTPQLICEVLYTDYQLTRAATGELTWQVPGSLSDGTVPTWT